MRTLAMLLILVAIATSQPHRWLVVLMAASAHCLGN